MPSHPLLTDFDALYLDDFFPRNPSGDSGAFMTQFNSQKTLIFLISESPYKFMPAQSRVPRPELRDVVDEAA